MRPVALPLLELPTFGNGWKLRRCSREESDAHGGAGTEQPRPAREDSGPKFFFNKIGAKLHVYLEGGTHHKHKRLFISLEGLALMIRRSSMVLASPGPPLTPPPSSSPWRSLSGPLPPKLHPAMGTRPRPRKAAAAAADGDGAREARLAPGRLGRTETTPRQRDCVEAVRWRHYSQPNENQPLVR